MKIEERKVFKEEDEAKIIAEILKTACEKKATRVLIESRESDVGIYFYMTGTRELWAVFPKEKKDEIIKRFKILASVKITEADDSATRVNSMGLFKARIDGDLSKTFFVEDYPAKHYEESLAIGINWGTPNKYETE